MLRLKSMCSKRSNSVCVWHGTKKLGLTLSSRTRKWPHTSSCSTALPKTSPSRLRRVGKSFCKRILGLSNFLCMWIQDFFLSNCPQTVRLSPHLSSTLYLITSAPRGCVLSPLLYSLYTVNCISSHPSNTIIKFADDTTTVGLISNRDESLQGWSLQFDQMVHRKQPHATHHKDQRTHLQLQVTQWEPLSPNHQRRGSGEGLQFSGVHISENLTWTVNTTALVKKKKKKAQPWLYFLRTLKKTNLFAELLKVFYHCSTESPLTYCITSWYANCTQANRTNLQRIIHTSQEIIRLSLPTLGDIFRTHCLCRASSILLDATQSCHQLLSLLPPGRRYRALKARTTRLKNSFVPGATIELNLNNHCPIAATTSA